jgi:DNA-binding MarR family transcriptional regulator
MIEGDDDDQGAFRWTDPSTSRAAARSIKISRIMRMILEYLARLHDARNGWEISRALGMQTITAVPRLAPMRRWGLIQQIGERPGPSNRAQKAYVITDRGRRLLDDAKDLPSGFVPITGTTA